MGPAVTVLVPCWNAARTIEGAIASVLAFRAAPLECLVIDDASTDGTPEVVERIAARDPRVTLLRQGTNQGVSAARNVGLEAAGGEWLTFLDADDRFTPDGLGALHRAAVASDALAVIGQQVWSDGRSHWLGPLYDVPDIRRPRRTSLAASPGLVYYASPHGKLFRRERVADLRFDGRVLGDQPWIIRAMLRAGDRLEVVGETVYEWIRVGPAGSGPSITATSRSSAARGIEATSVAAGALTAVMAEADRAIADPSRRLALGRTYVERLVRSDLGVHLARAIGRRDPALPGLLDGLAAFVAGLPPELVDRSPVVATELVLPLVRAWPGLSGEARAAARRLAAAGLRAQPDLADRAANPIDRAALHRALSGSTLGPDATAVALARTARGIGRTRDVPRGVGAVVRWAKRARPG